MILLSVWVVVAFAADDTITREEERTAALPRLMHLAPRVEMFASVDSSVVVTSDSARFLLPAAREVLSDSSTPLLLAPVCGVDSVVLYVRHSHTRCDTLARLRHPPWRTEWDYSGLPDQDQFHLQFGYRIFHPSGKTLVSGAMPHQWAIDRTTRKSRKVYHCRQVIAPDTVGIDGRLDEWKRARRAKIANHGFFWMQWSATHLYFAAQINASNIGQADFVELHLDPYTLRGSFASEAHRSIRFAPRSRSLCLVSCKKNSVYRQCDSIAALVYENMSWAVSFLDSGYVVEAALPFFTLSDLVFPKLRFGVDVTTLGNSPSRIFGGWANSHEYSRYNPGGWGTVVLHQAMLPLKVAMAVGLMVFLVVLATVLIVIVNHYVRLIRYEISEDNGGSEELGQIESCVRELLANRELTMDDVAEKIAMDAGDIERVLRSELDSTFDNYVAFQRIRRAKELLWNFSMQLDEVAGKCGFESVDDMVLRFRTSLNTDPESFREKLREAASGDGEKEGGLTP